MEGRVRSGPKKAGAPVGPVLAVSVIEQPDLVPLGHFHAGSGEEVVELGEIHSGFPVPEEETRQERLDAETREVQVEPGAVAADGAAEVGAPVP